MDALRNLQVAKAVQVSNLVSLILVCALTISCQPHIANSQATASVSFVKTSFFLPFLIS